MTDIITSAKNLLEDSTPGPWVAADSDILKESNGEFIGTISEYSGIDFDSEEYANTRLAAAAPELAAALAGETYEYIVQVNREGRWQFYVGESISPTDKPGLAAGFSQKKYAREFAKIEPQYPTRIVRRRVSEPEVMG